MASTATGYHQARAALLAAGINAGSDTFGMILCSSTYTPNYETHLYVSNLTNELSGNGYSRQALASVTTAKVGTGASARQKLTSNAVTFTSTAGNTITARYGILYKNTGNDATSPLIACILLDNTPADVSCSNGGTIQITPDATNGWLTV